MLNIKKLTKLYDKVNGIKNVDLTINEGEIFGFIGPNGAGKSTTIRTVLNLIHADSGKSYVNGIDSQKDTTEVLKIVGYLPSELNYYDKMKGIDILKFSEKFYGKDCSKKREYLAKILEVDLSKKVSDYSYGNKKKLGIVDALQHSPNFLILDEPTGGLDPLMQNKFFEILEAERENGATILFSSHILSEVEKVCDRVAIIKNGEILTVRDMDEMRADKVKRVKLMTNSQFVLSEESDVITNLTKENGAYSFLYNGEINELIKMLANYDIDDIQISEPNLEEIFIHYYE